MRISLTFLAFSVAGVASFQDGDLCGVKSSDFLNDYFEGDYLVAGATGCTLSDGSEGCYCAPDLNDQDSLSEWKWQCNGSVEFGPVGDKICPESVPVPKGYKDILIVPKQAGDSEFACNTTVNPTGRPGDAVCPYSDCDEGGSGSAICGCVDLAAYNMGEGMQWFCMHSTCSCEGTAEDVAADEGGASTVDTSSAPMAYSALVLAAALVLAMAN